PRAVERLDPGAYLSALTFVPRVSIGRPHRKSRFLGTPELAEQRSANEVEVRVAGCVDICSLFEQGETRGGTFCAGNSERAVDSHCRDGPDCLEHPIESGDLLPVGVVGARCAAVNRSDGGLDLERSRLPRRQRPFEELRRSSDRTVVPSRTVLDRQ